MPKHQVVLVELSKRHSGFAAGVRTKEEIEREIVEALDDGFKIVRDIPVFNAEAAVPTPHLLMVKENPGGFPVGD